MIDIIIYSKNRPLQLYALLESLYALTDAVTATNVSVIYKYDDPYRDCIAELQTKFNAVKFIQQEDFRRDTLTTLITSTNQFCTFLVDDIIFKSGVSFNDIEHLLSSNPSVLTFSMRMGLHLNYCYPTNTHQPIPNGTTINEIFVWDWTQASGDWAYPVSLDGHIFKKSDILKWTSKINFSNPNQLEDYLQNAFKIDAVSKQCVCHARSLIVNLPLNRVQNEYKNRCGEISVEELYDIWIKGKKIDTQTVVNINNNSAHYPTNIAIVERN
jgi:hypothetical protein